MSAGALAVALDVFAGGCLLLGAGFALTAALGIVRFPDILTRMHPASKAQLVGLLLVLVGTGVRVRHDPNAWMLALVGLFTLLTTPVITHLLGRTAYREGQHQDAALLVDELADWPDPPK